jgi:hypothetical protein
MWVPIGRSQSFWLCTLIPTIKIGALTTHPKTDNKDWCSEACFIAVNAPAYLYHYFGDVGLSFFPKYIGNAVKALGWNEIEDRLVTVGEEALNQVLKPYTKDSKMNAMFDFSKMEASVVKDDIQQQQSCRPQKQGTSNSPLGMEKPAVDSLLPRRIRRQFRFPPKKRRRHTAMLFPWGAARHSHNITIWMDVLANRATNQRFTGPMTQHMLLVMEPTTSAVSIPLMMIPQRS